MLGIDTAPEATKESDARRVGCRAVGALFDTSLSFVIQKAR